jgi:hypothetical protein
MRYIALQTQKKSDNYGISIPCKVLEESVNSYVGMDPRANCVNTCYNSCDNINNCNAFCNQVFGNYPTEVEPVITLPPSVVDEKIMACGLSSGAVQGSRDCEQDIIGCCQSTGPEGVRDQPYGVARCYDYAMSYCDSPSTTPGSIIDQKIKYCAAGAIPNSQGCVSYIKDCCAYDESGGLMPISQSDLSKCHDYAMNYCNGVTPTVYPTQPPTFPPLTLPPLTFPPITFPPITFPPDTLPPITTLPPDTLPPITTLPPDTLPPTPEPTGEPVQVGEGGETPSVIKEDNTGKNFAIGLLIFLLIGLVIYYRNDILKMLTKNKRV